MQEIQRRQHDLKANIIKGFKSNFLISKLNCEDTVSKTV